MTVIYVPRVFGGTIIYSPPAPPPPSNLATVLLVATFRSSQVPAMFRSGNTMEVSR